MQWCRRRPARAGRRLILWTERLQLPTCCCCCWHWPRDDRQTGGLFWAISLVYRSLTSTSDVLADLRSVSTYLASHSALAPGKRAQRSRLSWMRRRNARYEEACVRSLRFICPKSKSAFDESAHSAVIAQPRKFFSNFAAFPILTGCRSNFELRKSVTLTQSVVDDQFH